VIKKNPLESFPRPILAWRQIKPLFAAVLLLTIALLQLRAQTLTVGPNVNINRQTGYQGEEAIAIDPTNPNRMFAWSNTLNNNNSAAFTTNGGASWTSRFTGGDGWPALGGDPTCTFDSFGNLFAASFSSSFGSILVRESSDAGQTFPTALLTITSSTLDQPTIKAGPGTNASLQAVWITYFTSGGLVARGARVTGAGAVGAFGAALSIPSSSSGNFGDLAIGPAGRVAVAYQTPASDAGPSTIKVAVNSTGNTVGSFTLAAGTVATTVGGFRLIPAQPNRSVDAELGLAYDNTAGPHRGRLYLVYTDAPTTNSNDLNIFTRYSDNDGASWSSPLRVNTDAGTNTQFFSKIALDPTTGNIGVVWYDCRSSAANNRVELWGTVSVDGGASFLPEVKISAGSTSGVGLGIGNELGDYLGLDFYNNVLYPVWADDSNSTGDNPNGTADLDYYGARVTFVPAPVPSLTITNAHSFGASTVVTLTWTNLGGLLVLENSGILPGVWGTVTSTRTTNANRVFTTVTNAASAQFYRLKR
jgi:hypothetical protein